MFNDKYILGEVTKLVEADDVSGAMEAHDDTDAVGGEDKGETGAVRGAGMALAACWLA